MKFQMIHIINNYVKQPVINNIIAYRSYALLLVMKFILILFICCICVKGCSLTIQLNCTKPHQHVSFLANVSDDDADFQGIHRYRCK